METPEFVQGSSSPPATIENEPAFEEVSERAKRNEVGVQLLSRKIHEQVFPPSATASLTPPSQEAVNIAVEHLKTHGLDPSQGSLLPSPSFTLPPLQGQNLDEHFHRIGKDASEPWLGLAERFAKSDLLPIPEHFLVQPGWTKYDKDNVPKAVEYPTEEEMLVFDVESLPSYSPYAIMACAASPTAWYVWLSPWLLGKTTDMIQLIPFGDTAAPKLVVGHNVSYDRARIREEYSLNGTNTRFLDTMSLHVAVKGISSHQRPAWMKYRKERERQLEEAVEAVKNTLADGTAELPPGVSPDPNLLLELFNKRHVSSTASTRMDDDGEAEAEAEAEADAEKKRWEEITSVNSLAEVAKLHCGIMMDKKIRNDFMTCTREKIAAPDSIERYLAYCARDVDTTHKVFQRTLPMFLAACPSPVSFAGVLTMGSSFLTVNEEWEKYIERADGMYREMQENVKKKMVELAEEAKRMGISEGEKWWKDDPWMSQLDWSLKVARESRGVPTTVTLAEQVSPMPTSENQTAPNTVPAWYMSLCQNGPLNATNVNNIVPYLLRLSYKGCPYARDTTLGWHYLVDGEPTRLPTAEKCKASSPLNKKHGEPALQAGYLESNVARDKNVVWENQWTAEIIGQVDPGESEKRIMHLAEEILAQHGTESFQDDPWWSHLDWTAREFSPSTPKPEPKPKSQKAKTPKLPPAHWPRWYWELKKPKKGVPPGSINITVRTQIAPLLLRLSWLGWPLFRSREHGWTFRVPKEANFETRAAVLEFFHADDEGLKLQSGREDGYRFYKLPHKDGDKANVGSPLGKTFVKYAQDGTLKSPGDEAREALDMNAQCSYWISARDRIINQMVVWEDKNLDMGFGGLQDGQKRGIIIPQVITMGTVTRRAIEKTWLTASNAKKNRVGSELKAMVRAPEGYSIVGADVDSEELWLASVIGDAQFGLHGATAIGWMTLEGTKSAGTDLHSKTAQILGISRDQAKVFNYSRIYGAGMRHAQLLLMQSSATILPDEAQKRAQDLYAQTKGKNTQRTDLFKIGRKFWFGGTESFVFNKLEEIALSDRPQTPALGCAVTQALAKEHLPSIFGLDYMTSRINWVVQSSGVDYLHLLIVAMEHLIKKYEIKARYLISIHDELRYLVLDADRYRAALALQIANLWTRCLFAYKLGMDDLPQGVAFFSSVDVDTILRKEVDLPCVTPSQPVPIPAGESLNIMQVLRETNGSLWPTGKPKGTDVDGLSEDNLKGYQQPNFLQHRAANPHWLQAQVTQDFAEIKTLSREVTGEKVEGGIGEGKLSTRSKKKPPGDEKHVDGSVSSEEAALIEEEELSVDERGLCFEWASHSGVGSEPAPAYRS